MKQPRGVKTPLNCYTTKPIKEHNLCNDPTALEVKPALELTIKKHNLCNDPRALELTHFFLVMVSSIIMSLNIVPRSFVSGVLVLFVFFSLNKVCPDKLQLGEVRKSTINEFQYCAPSNSYEQLERETKSLGSVYPKKKKDPWVLIIGQNEFIP